MNQQRTAKNRTPRPLLSVATGVCLGLLAPGAFGQAANRAAAEALFQDGRALFERGRFAEACPKLAESQGIDPATGTLLTLALCHEGEGKLASAWQEFTTVEGQARRAGREDRQTIAREHAAALRSRLSTLAVSVLPGAAGTPGLEVRVDGVVTSKGLWGVAVPVDGGEHHVEASAPGKERWQRSVRVKAESEAARVEIPVLAAADIDRATPPPPPPEVASKATPEREPALQRRTGLRVPALITAGGGVVLIGVSGYLALAAKSDYDAAAKACVADSCPPGPLERTEDARRQGTVATVLFAVGGAAVATGAVLWFVSPKPASAASAAGLSPGVGVGSRGLVVKGAF